MKEGIDTVFDFIRFGSKHFDTEKPWETRNTNMDACSETIYNCVQIIANLAVLLEAFLPFSSRKIIQWLSIENGWSVKNVPIGFSIPEPEILFERLDKKIMDEEFEKLRQQE